MHAQDDLAPFDDFTTSAAELGPGGDYDVLEDDEVDEGDDDDNDDDEMERGATDGGSADRDPTDRDPTDRDPTDRDPLDGADDLSHQPLDDDDDDEEDLDEYFLGEDRDNY